MPRGVRVEDQLSWTVVRMMAMKVPLERIAIYTGISTKTVGNIKRRFRDVADPCVPKQDPLLRWKGTKLSADQIQVSSCSCYKQLKIIVVNSLSCQVLPSVQISICQNSSTI
jgi:hypothetical protein